MTTETTDAGAEAGATTAELSNVQEGASQDAFPPNYDMDGGADAGNVDPGAAETEGAALDKPALPPLTVEEYQKRHDNMNAALRETRQQQRAARDEVTQLRARMEQMQTSQPQAFERFIVDANIADFEKIDWQRWEAANPEQAHADWREYQAMRARKEEFGRLDAAAAEQDRQAQGKAQLNAMVTTLHDQEAAFKEAKPDYDAAVSFLRDELAKEANANGYFGDEAEQVVMRHLLQVGARVHASGQDMAKFSYDMAVQRGFKAAADIAPMIAGQAAARTISDVGTAGGSGGGTFEEQMNSLDGAAGRAFWDKAKKSSRYR